MRRILPSVVTFAIAVATLMPSALALPQHGDEAEYAYISDYYGGKISRLDFSPLAGSDPKLDPGWSPATYWALTQPMGPRYIYALVLGLVGAPPPDLPRVGNDEFPEDPHVRLTDRTRNALRLTAVLLAAVGLALLAYRFQWPGVASAAVFLVIPHVPGDLARGWAEGPLLFAIGLAATTWGTRWFAPVCGLAAIMKLSAVPLWFLAFFHGFGQTNYRHIAGFLVAWGVWTVLEVPAWFLGGPLYLGMMLQMRSLEFSHQSTYANPAISGELFGHYFPTRYLWPIELALLLAVAVLIPVLWRRLRNEVDMWW